VTELDGRSYRERVRAQEKMMAAFLRDKFPGEEERESAADKIYGYAGALQDVYMEIGLQCGFALAAQLSRNVSPNNR